MDFGRTVFRIVLFFISSFTSGMGRLFVLISKTWLLKLTNNQKILMFYLNLKNNKIATKCKWK